MKSCLIKTSPGRLVEQKRRSDSRSAAVMDRRDDDGSAPLSFPVLPSPLSVSFDLVHVREFPMILGDNPSAAFGIPVTIDWTYQKEQVVTVERLERIRENGRAMEALRLTLDQRAELYVVVSSPTLFGFGRYLVL
jgi:hypothetical protein